MISFPNIKINLGLNIVEKRTDGFHNIETIFYPVNLHDALEFVEKKDNNATTLSISGIKVDGNLQDNLVVKAYNLLHNDFSIPSIDIYLRKEIPLGAGLGGGSADAVFMLKMLNDSFDLKLSLIQLEEYAARLGSDCPFFVQNKPVYASGRGEMMQAIDVSLKDYYIVLVKPAIHVPTVVAYSSCIPQQPAMNLQDIVKKPIVEWKGVMENDFENAIFPNYPIIKEIKDKLYEEGAIYASMSGSGSSVYGIFSSKKSLKNQFSGCFVWEGKLL